MNKIKALRKQHNLTLKQLAKELNISEGALSYYENYKREPSNEILLKLSEIFNVSIDYLLTGTDSKFSKPLNEAIPPLPHKTIEAESNISYLVYLYENIPDYLKIKAVAFLEGLYMSEYKQLPQSACRINKI